MLKSKMLNHWGDLELGLELGSVTELLHSTSTNTAAPFSPFLFTLPEFDLIDYL